jgi:hypothetical protein
MRNRLLAAPILAVVLLSGCSAVRIGRIQADPSRFHRKQVNVEGTVTQSFGAMAAGVYQIEDETGKIYVISAHGVPSKGSRVGVQGTVVSGVTVAGHAYGTAIRERSHKVK